METKKCESWLPIESNPTIINDYIQKLGFDTFYYSFQDLLSIEEWA